MRWPIGTRLMLDNEPVYVMEEGEFDGWVYLARDRSYDPPAWMHREEYDEDLQDPLAWLKMELHRADARVSDAGHPELTDPSFRARAIADAYTALADAVQLATGTADDDRRRSAELLAAVADVDWTLGGKL